VLDETRGEVDLLSSTSPLSRQLLVRLEPDYSFLHLVHLDGEFRTEP